jgi:hypothetical protein
MDNSKVEIYLTVDTEVWHDYRNLEKNLVTSVYGKTPDGEYGLEFLIDKLNENKLKATFFVEPLFSEVAGHKSLCNMVKTIQGGGHDTQLHIHTEWLESINNPFLPKKTGRHIKFFSLEQQITLLNYCRGLIKECGVENLCAFRAGNFGANNDTLKALAECKIEIDSSYNYCYLASSCDIQTSKPLFHPTHINGTLELPVTVFCDYPQHYRPLHLTACSFKEFKSVLLQAWEKGWASIVIVLHSFEMLHRNAEKGKDPTLNRVLLKRFTNLCRFLSENSDKFTTKMISDMNPKRAEIDKLVEPLNSNIWDTALRYVEQGRSRISKIF